MGLMHLFFTCNNRTTAACTQSFKYADPVIGLIVEDAVGKRRRVIPDRHNLGPVFSGALNAFRSSPGAFKRCAALGLYCEQWRRPTDIVHCFSDGGGECSTSNLNENAIDLLDADCCCLLADFPAERSAAIET